jgi:hypothetical protein
MPSSGVSLKPPLKAFARGVRIASVMTMSSGFLVVLQSACQPRNPPKLLMLMGETYMAERPLLEGEICETIAFSLSVILKDVMY